MLKNVKLRIAKWFIDTEDQLRADILKLADLSAVDMATRIRGEYIVITKLSRKLTEEIANGEEVHKGCIANNNHSMAAEIEEILAQKNAKNDEYKKKLFAFMGMFEAYKIPRITKEELQ